MSKKRYRMASAADECEMLRRLSQEPHTIKELAEIVNLSRNETLRILETYEDLGYVQQEWVLCPLKENTVEIQAVSGRTTTPFTLRLPTMGMAL